LIEKSAFYKQKKRIFVQNKQRYIGYLGQSCIKILNPQNIKIPPYLKENDTIAIVCTARKLTFDEVLPAVRLLNGWKLKVRIGKTIGLDNFQFSGSDRERAEDFQTMLNDPAIRAIWCARGGYGTARIIDRIDFSGFLENPKWIIGFSDVTVLHSHIHNLGVASIHSIMPFSVEKSTSDAKKKLQNSIFGKPISYKIPSSSYNKNGQAKGVLIGGNLSILYSLLGSKSSIDTREKILFIEDLDEYLYHIDRMAINLKRNGYFDKVKGIIVGGMIDMHDNKIPFGRNAYEIILDITKEFNIPICFDFPAGHLPDNRALILGKQIHFEVNNNFVWIDFFEEKR